MLPISQLQGSNQLTHKLYGFIYDTFFLPHLPTIRDKQLPKQRSPFLHFRGGQFPPSAITIYVLKKGARRVVNIP
jgi:hypothetical protein